MSEIKVLASLVSSEASLLDLQTTAFSLSPHSHPSVLVNCVLNASQEDTSHID